MRHGARTRDTPARAAQKCERKRGAPHAPRHARTCALRRACAAAAATRVRARVDARDDFVSKILSTRVVAENARERDDGV